MCQLPAYNIFVCVVHAICYIITNENRVFKILCVLHVYAHMLTF